MDVADRPLPGPSAESPGPRRALDSLPTVPFHVSIRFSSSSLRDLDITVPDINQSPPPTAAELRRQIRFLRPLETHNRRLRLILAGKILSDHVLLKVLHHQHSQRQRHLPPPSLKGKEKEDQAVDRLWIHCSIGEHLSDADFEQEERAEQVQSTLSLPTGFERLRSAGFTEDDIASLRAQFQRFHGSRAAEDGEDEDIDITALEERWLDDTIGLGGGEGPVEGGPSDSYEETLLGFIIGYFAVLSPVVTFSYAQGLFALFFIWEPGIGISRNLKHAIIAGVLSAPFLSLIRSWV